MFAIGMKAVARFVAVFSLAALSASIILTAESVMGGPNYVDSATVWLMLAILGSAFLLATRESWRTVRVRVAPDHDQSNDPVD